MGYLDRTDSFMASLGLETYRVGGSVRDQILGRHVKDADYMVRGTSLADLGERLRWQCERGDVVSKLKLRDGRHAGWRFHRKGLGLIEIMLPRTEVSTGPGHRDFKIVLNPELSIAEDAKRRDFTFNALYYLVPDGPVADPTAAGLHDLQHKLIRTTHEDSFRDDPLRTLRALRFVAVLGYDVARNTVEQMQRHATAVNGLTDKGVSGTALDELCKLLMGRDAARALQLAAKTGVLQVLLPELKEMIGFDQGSRYHDMTTSEHTFKAIETAAHVDAPLRVRMALLFHDAGKPHCAWKGDDGRKHYYEHRDRPFSENHEVVGARLAKRALTRLNADKRLRSDVETLVLNHMVKVSGRVKGSQVRRDRVKFGDEMLMDLHMHRICDISGKDKTDRNQFKHIQAREQYRVQAHDHGIPSSTKELKINGHDLIEMGAKGRQIGAALAAVLDEVVCQPSDQTLSREWQLERAKILCKN